MCFPPITLTVDMHSENVYAFPGSNYVNNRSTRKRCEVCSKLAINTLKTMSLNDVVLVSVLSTLNIFHIFRIVSAVEFEQVNVFRVSTLLI